MGNDIARQFAHLPADEAAEAVARHIADLLGPAHAPLPRGARRRRRRLPRPAPRRRRRPTRRARLLTRRPRHHPASSPSCLVHGPERVTRRAASGATLGTGDTWVPCGHRRGAPWCGSAATTGPSQDGPRKRVWVQNVAVRSEVLEAQLDAIETRGLSPAETKIAEGTRRLLTAARAAAFRDDPIPTRWGTWWRGTLVEAAYQNLHAAEGQLILLFDVNQLACGGAVGGVARPGDPGPGRPPSHGRLPTPHEPTHRSDAGAGP